MDVHDLGLRGYQEVLDLQKGFVERRARGEIPDSLILVEHPPVYTVGRAGAAEDGQETSREGPRSITVRKLGTVPVLEVERGGKLTFHGPGQLVGYPIFALPHHDLRRYLTDVERALMATLAETTGLEARPCPATLLLEPGQLQTGVWVRDRKIASIGIAVRKWVTYHGFALNLSTDLRYFEAVSPCGFQGAIMTSVAEELGAAADLERITAEVKTGLIERFRRISLSYREHVERSPAPEATL